ncbi:MAG: DUF952 domain-containing protein [Bacteroidetes bacterium]|nr:DUF952 domain-containing protein [Bacteroidota bacterium]
MQEDLIFYAVSRRKWSRMNSGGYFTPEDFDPDRGFKCALPHNLQDYLNADYSGRKNLFLLVIDVSRLSTSIKKSKKEDYLYLYDPVNLDAILDKIKIDSNEEGKFDLSVKSYS